MLSNFPKNKELLSIFSKSNAFSTTPQLLQTLYKSNKDTYWIIVISFFKNNIRPLSHITL
jgi:hypothetical protein